MEVRIRGRGVDIVPTRNTHNRRALLYQNKIRTVLKHFGCHSDDFEFSDEKLAMRKSEAWVKFFSEYEECHISFNGCDNYADNMQAIAKLLELEEKEVNEGVDTLDNFFARYEVQGDVTEERVEARKTLGVPIDCMDWKVIDSKFKELSRKAHPDMGGSVEEFKKLNLAHKVLKKELA